MKYVVRRVRPHLVTLGAVLALASPNVASARELVFAETWDTQGAAIDTARWRTKLGDGTDCRVWPTCAFVSPTIPGPTFPPALLPNAIQVRDGDGAGGRDANTCSGKYINVPRAVAGYGVANVAVTGGVNQNGNVFKNAQFPVAPGARLCVVAWVRAFDQGANADWDWGPYVGINYTGAHGVIDGQLAACTHFLIGPPQGWQQDDLANVVACTMAGQRPGYGPMTSVRADSLWHRYTKSFTVSVGDVSTDWQPFSPGLPGTTTWDDLDTTIYGQLQLELYGDAPERNDGPWGVGAPKVLQHDADFGDIYVFKADNGVEDPCPTDAELDQLRWVSDHAPCPAGSICTKRVESLPATAIMSAYDNNDAYLCIGCSKSYGEAQPGLGVCTLTTPFCIGPGALHAGTCTACGADADAAVAIATKCAAATPTCFTEGFSFGACGKCADNASCAAFAHPGRTCDPVSGACFACNGDNASVASKPCPAGAPRCDKATGLCGKCTWNDECAGADHAGPLCHAPSGQCTTCASDFGGAVVASTCLAGFPHCLTAPMGLEPAGVCGKCLTAVDCVNPGPATHAGPICNAATGLCGKCDGDKGVSFTPYACAGAALPTCSNANGSCIKCTSNADCVNLGGPNLHAFSVCNPTSGACEGPPAPDAGVDSGVPDAGGDAGPVADASADSGAAEDSGAGADASGPAEPNVGPGERGAPIEHATTPEGCTCSVVGPAGASSRALLFAIGVLGAIGIARVRRSGTQRRRAADPASARKRPSPPHRKP